MAALLASPPTTWVEHLIHLLILGRFLSRLKEIWVTITNRTLRQFMKIQTVKMLVGRSSSLTTLSYLLVTVTQQSNIGDGTFRSGLILESVVNKWAQMPRQLTRARKVTT